VETAERANLAVDQRCRHPARLAFHGDSGAPWSAIFHAHRRASTLNLKIVQRHFGRPAIGAEQDRAEVFLAKALRKRVAAECFLHGVGAGPFKGFWRD
jgi:hypothetical protein